jgi:hypothetical protein
MGSFAYQSWFQSLHDFLVVNSGTIAWASINFAGSSLTDLAARAHSQLQSIQGNGGYHLNATEQSRIAGYISIAGDPTTSDIASGQWAVYKNTTSGVVKLWANNAGTMKSVALT